MTSVFCTSGILAKFKPLLDAYGGPYKDKYDSGQE